LGWRGLFAVGGLPAWAAFFIRRRLGESPKFIEARAVEARAARTTGGAATARRGAITALFKDKATTRITLAMMVLTTVQNAGYFGIMTWLPTYLSKVIGLSINASSVWTAVTVSGMILGILAFGQLADRIGRRGAFWIFQTGAACSVLVYSQLNDPAVLLLGGFVMGAFANGMLGGYGALIAELYPTEVRATAQNLLFNIGRGLGGFAPVVIAAVAATRGFAFALALLPIIYLVQFAAMFVLPERRGVELE
jgi:MFS family permease